MINKIKKKGKHKNSKPIEIKHQPKPRPLDAESYLRLLCKSSNSAHIFVVLDARNPNSCRYIPYEESMKEKLTIVLNKIDLIPRESMIGWLYFLKASAPTFAISATNSIQHFVDHIKSLGKTSILITGVGNVGKKTIISAIKDIDDLTINSETWTWLQPTPDLAIMNAIDRIPPECDIVFGVHDIIGRSSIHSLMDVFHITFFSDPGRLLQTLDKQPQTAARMFFDGLASGKWPYYTVPPCQVNEIELSKSEKDGIKCSLPYDCFEVPFIMIGYGTTNVLKPVVLNILHQIAFEKQT